jgi:hypothetical protein
MLLTEIIPPAAGELGYELIGGIINVDLLLC